MQKYNLISIMYPSNKKHRTYIYICHNKDNLQKLRNIGCDYHIYGIKYNKPGEKPTIYGYVQFHSPKTEMRSDDILDCISIAYTEKPANMIRNFKRYLNEVWETGILPYSKTDIVEEPPTPVVDFDKEQSKLFQPKYDRITAQMKETDRLFEEEEKEWQKQMEEKEREKMKNEFV